MKASSKYLIDEYPMTMLPSLASRIGGDEAIVLQQIQYWIKTHEAVGNERVFKDGRWWVFNTVQQWQEKQFIWLAVPTVKRILQSLREMGLVSTEQFEKNSRNNRKWYTVNYDSVERLDLVPIGTCFTKLEDRIILISSILTGSNRSDGADQNDPMTGSKRSDGADQIDPVIISKEITKETKENTPLPLIEEKHAPAIGDFGSKEPTPQPLEKEVVSDSYSQAIESEEMGVDSFGESKEVIAARDNKAKRVPDGDKFFGRKAQERHQQSFAAKLQRTVVPIEEMAPWCSFEIFKEFEAYLLEDARKWCKSNPASVVARKLQEIASGKAVKTEFEEWQAQKEQTAQKLQPQPTEDRSALTPEQQAWIAIVEQFDFVSEGASAKVSLQNSIWIVTSNVAQLSGRLGEAMGRVSLESLPTKFKAWYPDCYRRAVQKFPHLPFPEPLDPERVAS